MRRERRLTPFDLGFQQRDDPASWWKAVGGRARCFRRLESMDQLAAVESLQRETFGVTDLDLVPASELIVIEETGGFVIGAFGADGSLLGVVVGWGGFVRERPRIVSDFLGVRSDVRALGLGTELKKLQAALALERGFSEIVWTVDPLRAGNARLNFEKLGAYADRYEVNRYGEGFGTGLYGGLPTDRVHLTWPIASPAVHERLLGRVPPRTSADLAGVPRFEDGNDAGQAVIEIPADIDALLARDSSAARDWRLRLRTSLQQAFTQGFRIIGFVPATNPDEDRSTYLIERCTD